MLLNMAVSDELIKDGDSAIEITKNNGKHIMFATVADLRRGRRDGQTTIVTICGLNFGFNTQYLNSFIKINSVPDADLRTAQDWFDILR